MSAAGYDAGKEWEAERLSAAVFTLVHDHGSISSLPSQLGVTLRFVSSGGVVTGHGLPAPAIAFPSLLIFEGDTDGRDLSPSSTVNHDLDPDRQIIPAFRSTIGRNTGESIKRGNCAHQPCECSEH